MPSAQRPSRAVKPVQPVKGSCRWLVKLVVGLRAGRLEIATQAGVTAVYTVTAHQDDKGRVLGYRLSKAGTAESASAEYDIDADLWECSCPDYLWRSARREKAGLPAACKHSAALRKAVQVCPILV